MFSEGKLLIFHGLTPLHPGSGSSLSYVDLPVQRERHTSYPAMTGSSIKGVIRDLASRTWGKGAKGQVEDIFGSEGTGGKDSDEGGGKDSKASQIAFTDAKILLYPVRSVRGVFAWITCPFVLRRFVRDVSSVDNGRENAVTLEDLKDLSSVNEDAVIISKESTLKMDEVQKTVGIEEFILKYQDHDLTSFCEKISKFFPSTVEKIGGRIAIVSDSVFKDMVNYAVEVRTRIKIDQTKGTVQEGALFVTEMVPAEAVFYGLMLLKENDAGQKMETLLRDKTIQIGGDETIGCGLVRLKLS